MSGEYCTIPNGTEAPGKLLISPTVLPPLPVPIRVLTCSTGLATRSGGSYAVGVALASIALTSSAAATSAAAPRRDRITVSYSSVAAWCGSRAGAAAIGPRNHRPLSMVFLSMQVRVGLPGALT